MGQYTLLVVDGDGDTHRIQCSGYGDLLNWMEKFMIEAFETRGTNVIFTVTKPSADG